MRKEKDDRTSHIFWNRGSRYSSRSRCVLRLLLSLQPNERSSTKRIIDASVCKSVMFSEYGRIFAILLPETTANATGSQVRNDKPSENGEDLILPSDEDWRCRVYYRLVELQRECDNDFARKRVEEALPETETMSDVDRKRNGWEWEPKNNGSRLLKAKPKKRRIEESKEGSLTSVCGIDGVCGSMTETRVHLGWRVNDIPLAASILRKDQPPRTYSDEAELRRVFGLVYDVFRYKRIFSRALEDVGFWRDNEAIKDQEKVAWLLVYDMQGRKFARPRAGIDDVVEREKIFQAAGLINIENALLEVKTHLAASISRLRIRGSALNLDELLPTRLRVIEGISWGEQDAIATGWINTAKIASKEEFLREMSKLKLVCCENEEETEGGGGLEELDETEYAFDSICPKMINLHECAREAVAVSSLVRCHRFVFLERSLCLGAAVLARLIRNGRLCGPIILTHSLAPRHTGYLAGLLADIDHAGRLLAFGAGDHRCEYESYLKDLGVTLQQCRVFSEKYVSHPAISELERATVVLAVPPCSYTGVKDIVDLAVARGGDSDLLESLTDTYVDVGMSDDCCDHEKCRTFLADQMATLKYALTRPNVQFLLYEVHTILPLETTEMVQAVIEYVNRIAMEKYIREHPKKASKEDSDVSKSEGGRFSTFSVNVTVPNSDLFEIGSIDDIYGKNVSSMLDPGCFLAVIRRKEMMQFDSLFMIKVAESKGLFGYSAVRGQPKLESVQDRSLRRPQQNTARKGANRATKIEIERIMAHTYSSLSRSTRGNRICPRHERCAGWIDATGFQATESFNLDAKVSNVDVSSAKAWQRQKVCVNRLCAAASRKSSRKKAAPKPEETSSPLNKLLTIERLPQRQEYENDRSASTTFRSPIIARAVRRVPLEDDNIEVREEEKIQRRLKMNYRYWSSRKTSRLLHPAGSPSNVLDSLFDVV